MGRLLRTFLPVGSSLFVVSWGAIVLAQEPGPPSPPAPAPAEPAPAAPEGAAAAEGSDPPIAGALFVSPPGADQGGPPVTLDLGLNFGLFHRLDDEPTLALDRATGVAFGGGFMVNPKDWFGIGLSYDHADLGRSSGELPGRGFVSVTRDLNSLWLDVRIRPVRLDDLSVFFNLGPGFAWQSADAVALLNAGALGARPTEVTCEGSDAARLGLRSAVGLELRLKGPVWFHLATGFEGASLTTDPLDTCVLGSGTTNAFTARAGFVGRVDLTEAMR